MYIGLLPSTFSALQLITFIEDLLSEGKVTVHHELSLFDTADVQATLLVLERHHAHCAEHFPATAPEYDGEAALWAAKHIYYAVQLSLLRHIEAATVEQLMMPYQQLQSAAAIYSADLCLRYLNDVLRLSAGLAPGDVLVRCLHHTARQWPFSAAGINAEPAEAATDEQPLEQILNHQGLAITFADRVIARQDMAKAMHPRVLPYVLAALGQHQQTLWPALHQQLQTNIEPDHNDS